MLPAILNKSWKQYPTKHPLYGHQPPITKTIKIRWTRHAGHCWRSRDELISDDHLWTPHMAEQKKGDKLELTYSSSVRIRDVALRTCQKRWTIERSGDRGSGISVLEARQDDDADDNEGKSIPQIMVRKSNYYTTWDVQWSEKNICLNSFSFSMLLSYSTFDLLELTSWSGFFV